MSLWNDWQKNHRKHYDEGLWDSNWMPVICIILMLLGIGIFWYYYSITHVPYENLAIHERQLFYYKDPRILSVALFGTGLGWLVAWYVTRNIK